MRLHVRGGVWARGQNLGTRQLNKVKQCYLRDVESGICSPRRDLGDRPRSKWVSQLAQIIRQVGSRNRWLLSQGGRVWSTARTRLVPTPTPTRTGVVGKYLRGHSSCNSDVTSRRSLTPLWGPQLAWDLVYFQLKSLENHLSWNPATEIPVYVRILVFNDVLTAVRLLVLALCPWNWVVIDHKSQGYQAVSIAWVLKSVSSIVNYNTADSTYNSW